MFWCFDIFLFDETEFWVLGKYFEGRISKIKVNDTILDLEVPRLGFEFSLSFGQ